MRNHGGRRIDRVIRGIFRVRACMGVHPRAVMLDARVKLRAGGYYIAKLKEKKTNRSRAVLGDHVAQCRK